MLVAMILVLLFPELPVEPFGDFSKMKSFDILEQEDLILLLNYDLNENGIEDYSVLRTINEVFWVNIDKEGDTLPEIAKRYPNKLVFYQHEEDNTYKIYITEKYGFMYWYNKDELGSPEYIWSDPHEDGVNGNEILNDVVQAERRI